MDKRLLQGKRALRDVYFENPDALPAIVDDPIAWLYDNALQVEGAFLLAHALDGVIWGRVTNGQLVTGHDIAPENTPQLRIETLEQVRLFTNTAEWYLWHDGRVWYIRETLEINGVEGGAFDELQILWGDYAEARYDGFTLLSEGMQGLNHVVPISVSDAFPKKHSLDTVSRQRVVLHLRHYLAPGAGVQTIVRSRLVKIEEVNNG